MGLQLMLGYVAAAVYIHKTAEFTKGFTWAVGCAWRKGQVVKENYKPYLAVQHGGTRPEDHPDLLQYLEEEICGGIFLMLSMKYLREVD